MENFPGVPGPPSNTGAAKEAVSTPAILLMVTGVLGIVGALLGLAQSALGGGGIPPELLNDPNLEAYRPWLERSQSFGAFGNLIALALSGVTFFGALKMKNLENFGLAMAASIIALIPCFGPCCCIGIPAGIWALVVLNKPEVKSAFRPG
jgi:hypothetical protein